MKKDQAPKLGAQTVRIDDDDVDLTVRERVDPTEQAEIDGDPAYDYRLQPGDAGIPSDLVAVWAHQKDVQRYKGRRWRDARPDDNIKFLSDRPLEEGRQIEQEDHVLLVRDKAYHERVYAGERASNRKARRDFIKAANKAIYVNVPGNASPRPMSTRS